MRPERFQHWPCPIARSADLMGDPWVPMILRECTYGVRRFDAFQKRLSVSPNILATRLDRMVEQGLLEKTPYQDRPVRYEYRLTKMGTGATILLAAMVRFANEWVFEDGQAPIVLRDRRDGHALRPALIDESTGEPIALEHVVPSPGPGFPGDADAQRAWFGDDVILDERLRPPD